MKIPTAGIYVISSLMPLTASGTNLMPTETDSVRISQLEEIVISGHSARQRISDTRLGAERLEISKLSLLPRMFGEHDIIKSLALLPGVRSEGDGGGGFEVRGGTASQNLIMLDGITLYNPSHVMGIFSTFNDDAISGATLFKGPVPSSFGNALSSVLETTMASGDMTNYNASGTIGLLAAKLSASGPIIKDKLSFALSARRSYADMFIAMVPKFKGTIMNFYDLTAKLRFVPNPTHRIDISFILGHDNMAVKDIMGMYWGNIGGSLEWMARPTDNINFTTTASATDYSPDMSNTMMEYEQRLREYIRNVSINERIDFSLNETQDLEFGFRSEFLRVKSAEMIFNGNVQKEVRSGWQNSIWGNYDASFGRYIALSAGVRLGLYSALSGAKFHEFSAPSEEKPNFFPRNYTQVEPRISIKLNPSEFHTVRFGFSVTSQDIHSLRSSSTSFPFDRYALASSGVEPERCIQYGLGYGGMTENGDFDWQIEGYYKHLAHVYDYRDGCTMYSRISLESIISEGRGRSGGLEFTVRKNNGRLTGWLSYTLSKTQTKISGINDGHWYDASNDRTHDFKITALFRLTDRWNLSGAWFFSSGQPLTAPDVKYLLDGITCYYYSKRNSYRTPPTHRLDLSATYTHKGKKLTYEWTFGIYNVYNRYNPYLVYFRDDPDRPGCTEAVQHALFGIVPSVSYTLKF